MSKSVGWQPGCRCPDNAAVVPARSVSVIDLNSVAPVLAQVAKGIEAGVGDQDHVASPPTVPTVRPAARDVVDGGVRGGGGLVLLVGVLADGEREQKVRLGLEHVLLAAQGGENRNGRARARAACASARARRASCQVRPATRSAFTWPPSADLTHLLARVTQTSPQATFGEVRASGLPHPLREGRERRRQLQPRS